MEEDEAGFAGGAGSVNGRGWWWVKEASSGGDGSMESVDVVVVVAGLIAGYQYIMLLDRLS